MIVLSGQAKFEDIFDDISRLKRQIDDARRSYFDPYRWVECGPNPKAS